MSLLTALNGQSRAGTACSERDVELEGNILAFQTACKGRFSAREV